MLDKLRELKAQGEDWVSIGIEAENCNRSVNWVPWQSMADAFNMKTPTVYLTPEDLEDPEFWSLVEDMTVAGFYAYAPLKDYAVLSRLTELRDVYLEFGDDILDLEFLRPLTNLRMFYVENACLSDLEVLLDLQDKFLGLSCVGLWNCTVEDLSDFHGRKHWFSEFLIWMPEEAKEQERWKDVNAGTFAYFEFKEQE